MEAFQLTSHTDGEVVSKHLSDVPDKIRSIGETIRDWFPLLTVRGIWTRQNKNASKTSDYKEIQGIFNFTSYHNQNRPQTLSQYFNAQHTEGWYRTGVGGWMGGWASACNIENKEKVR